MANKNLKRHHWFDGNIYLSYLLVLLTSTKTNAYSQTCVKQAPKGNLNTIYTNLSFKGTKNVAS